MIPRIQPEAAVNDNVSKYNFIKKNILLLDLNDNLLHKTTTTRKSVAKINTSNIFNS